jgi:hypothetical protein
MKTSSKMKTYEIHKTLQVEHKPTGVRGIHVYRATWLEEGKDPVVQEGICRKQDLPTPENPIPNLRWWKGDSDPRKHGIWSLFSQKDIDRQLDEGYWLTWDTEDLECDECLEKPYTHWDDSNVILVRDFPDGHMMFYKDGSPVPLALYVEYIHWHVTNIQYDLSQAKEILSRRKDIHDLSLEHIPYYNKETSGDLFLSWKWKPSKEDFAKIWNYILEQSWGYPSTKIPCAVKELDFWGIEKVRNDLKDGSLT